MGRDGGSLGLEETRRGESCLYDRRERAQSLAPDLVQGNTMDVGPRGEISASGNHLNWRDGWIFG